MHDKISHAIPPIRKALHEAWELIGGSHENIGRRLLETYKLIDEGKLASLQKIKPPRNEKAQMYLGYGALLHYFYQKEGAAENVRAAIEADPEWWRKPLHSRDIVIPALFFESRDETQADALAASDPMFGHLLGRYKEAAIAYQKQKAARHPYDNFVRATLVGLHIVKSICGPIFEILDTPRSENMIRGRYEISVDDTKALAEAKREIALRSYGEAQHVAFSHGGFLSRLIHDADHDEVAGMRRYRLEVDSDGKLFVTTRRLREFMRIVHEGRLTSQIAHEYWKLVVPRKMRTSNDSDTAVGCPAAYSPLFMQIGQWTINAHYNAKNGRG